jgi:hypothetical protein
MGQVFIQSDSLGFKDTLRALPDSIVWIPIQMATDSAVSGVSMNFAFNHNILWPVIGSDQYDPETMDSTDVVWYMTVRFTQETRTYLGVENTDMIVVVPYYLQRPDTALFLMYPSLDTVRTVPGGLSTDYVLAELQFKVNPAANIEADTAKLTLFRQSPSYHMTEFAQQWTIPDEDPTTTDTQTKSVWPTMMNSIFIVDTAVADPGPGPDENDPPVVNQISPNTYTIKQGETASFTVTATDAEGGEVRLWANQGTGLPANATLSPSNPVIGTGGTVSGDFSFRPDVTQNGNFVFTFSAVDDSGATSITSQIVTVSVEELDFDVLFTTSMEGMYPEGGIPGLNEVLVPINIVTKKEIFGIQFDLEYNDGYFQLDSIINSERILNWITYDNVGATPGDVRVITFGVANDPMVAGTTSAVLYLAFTVDDYAKTGCYPLAISNAFESIDPNPEIPSLELQTDSGTLCVDMLGDVNLNHIVEVDDAVGIVGYIIRNFDLNRRRFAIADVVVSDTVNVVDLVGVINLAFDLPLTPKQQIQSEYLDEIATLRIVHDEIPAAGMNSTMKILADMPVPAAGVEMDILYNPNMVKMFPPQLAEGADGFDLRSKDDGAGYMKVLLYSWRPWDDTRSIQQGLSEIVKLPCISVAPIAAEDNYQVKITRAYVSTGAARSVAVQGMAPGPLPDKFVLYQNHPNPFNPETTIEFYIDGSNGIGFEQVKLEIFNILGQSIKTLIDEPLPPGQHSIIWDGTGDEGQRMATGVYLYRMKVDNESQTKKMLLLK